MNSKDILNFKDQIRNLSKEELEAQKLELQEKLSKMVLDSDLICKIVIIEALLKKKTNEE